MLGGQEIKEDEETKLRPGNWENNQGQEQVKDPDRPGLVK